MEVEKEWKKLFFLVFIGFSILVMLTLRGCVNNALPLSHIFWVQKKKKKKKGVATKGSVETVPQQACAEKAVASE